MKYTFMQIVGSKFKTAVVHTADAVVVEASPAFTWAVGLDINDVIGWATSRGFTCKCCGVPIYRWGS